MTATSAIVGLGITDMGKIYDRSGADFAAYNMLDFWPMTGMSGLRLAWGEFGANPSYALAARRYMHQYGTTSDHFAAIAMGQRQWELMNPKAQIRKPLTLEDYHASRWVVEPLHLFDCCLVSNGAVAFVITSAVAAMRDGGIELIAGVVRDPQWGPALAVGLGGTQAEVLRDRGIASLPVTERVVGRMLAGLRGYELLHGFRGQAAADLDRVCEVLAGFGQLAFALGPALQSMEINPLYVAGSRVEILDAVLVWPDVEAAHAD